VSAHSTVGRELAKGAGRFVGHVFALLLGLVLMVVGIAMGVTIALLPIGIPVGFAGLFLFLWALFGGVEEHKLPPYPLEKQ
jgi:uncharacterized membrane protein YccF (DUF307 family)